MPGHTPDPAPEDIARWLALEPGELLRQCSQSPYQGPGPGGQKRNRVYSGVRLTHAGSGLTAESSENREARRNLEEALHRLRMALALASPREGALPGAIPAPGFRPGASGRHEDFPRFAFAALGALAFRGGRLSEAAADLGCSASALTRFLLQDKGVWAKAQAVRKRHGLHPLKSG